MSFRTLFSTFLLLLSPLAAAGTETIRIGALAFGTLSWELAVIKAEGLDKAEDLAIEATTLAGTDAARIALLGKSVDLIIGDWLWVAQQRLKGQSFSFAPYSSNHGALVVPAGSTIRGIADLPGKRLGIAGGGLDKNWLLLRALAQKSGIDLDRSAITTFAAPPLLNQDLQQGKLDAVLTYWNHAARLEALGYRQVLDGRAILKGLGIEADLPMLGYVFREEWAEAHGAALSRFFRLAAEAKRRICEVDASWARVAALTEEPEEKVRMALRRGYCEGRAVALDAAGKAAAATVFALVEKTGEGKETSLPPGVFWSPPQ